jgi:hypothetical protein
MGSFMGALYADDLNLDNLDQRACRWAKVSVVYIVTICDLIEHDL